MWFVGLLLLLSLGYAAWAGPRPHSARPPRPLTSSLLLVVVGLVALGSFLIRLVLPFASSTPLNLDEWQWPECFALFGIGILASRQGWLHAVPEHLARQARTATIGAGVVTALFLLGSLPFGVSAEDLLGGWHGAALVVDCVEGLITVFGCVWMLAVAQRCLDRPFGHGPELARSAYAAFLVQGFVLIGLAVALRPLPVTADVQAAVTGSGPRRAGVLRPRAPGRPPGADAVPRAVTGRLRSRRCGPGRRRPAGRGPAPGSSA